MKSKRLFIVVFVLLLSFTTGCTTMNPTISEGKAKSIVLQNHSGNNGQVVITSVVHKSGEYIISWNNKGNCESGKDYIDDQSGSVTKGEATIC